MKKYKLDKFTRGWFIGNFEPSLFKTEQFEVAIKQYKKGDKETPHIHKVADEFSVVVKGSCKFNGEIFSVGDIIHIEPGEIAEFEALEDCVTTVIKTPSVIGDKYEV